ncbi:MAG TPA: cbb3-type cytochrome oxidase assembly protein CcoS [Armatimonadota bacterium]|nr:cbb3-type cytochrome oxidase assembly protein CcoS [Armatimonadota bacterium]
MTLLDVWLGYTAIGVMIFSILFAWAVRNGQFADMERARRIALDAAKPVERSRTRVSTLDRYTWVGIVLIALAMLGSVLWVALRG